MLCIFILHSCCRLLDALDSISHLLRVQQVVLVYKTLLSEVISSTLDLTAIKHWVYYLKKLQMK